MEQEVTRTRELPAFKIGIEDLETLVESLSALFDKPEEVELTIKIPLRFNKVSFRNFNSFEAFSEYAEPRGRINSFTILLSQGGRNIHISTLGFIPAVTACAASVAWCGGAIESVYTFIKSKRRWYYWFTLRESLIYINFYIYIYATSKTTSHADNLMIFASMILSLILITFFGAKRYLLPSTIVATTKSSIVWLIPEIVLAGTLISIVVFFVTNIFLSIPKIASTNQLLSKYATPN